MSTSNQFQESPHCKLFQKCGKMLHRNSHIIFISETICDVIEYMMIFFSIFNFNKSLNTYPIDSYSIIGNAICIKQNVTDAQTFSDPEKLKDFLDIILIILFFCVFTLLLVLSLFTYEFFIKSREDLGSHLINNYKAKRIEREKQNATQKQFWQGFFPSLKVIFNMILVGLLFPIEAITLGDCIEINFSEDIVYLIINFLIFCGWSIIAVLASCLMGVFMLVCKIVAEDNKDCNNPEFFAKAAKFFGSLGALAGITCFLAFMIMCVIIWGITNIANMRNFFFCFFAFTGETLEIIYLSIPCIASGCFSCLRSYSDIVSASQQEEQQRRISDSSPRRLIMQEDNKITTNQFSSRRIYPRNIHTRSSQSSHRPIYKQKHTPIGRNKQELEIEDIE